MYFTRCCMFLWIVLRIYVFYPLLHVSLNSPFLTDSSVFFKSDSVKYNLATHRCLSVKSSCFHVIEMNLLASNITVKCLSLIDANNLIGETFYPWTNAAVLFVVIFKYKTPKTNGSICLVQNVSCKLKTNTFCIFRQCTCILCKNDVRFTFTPSCL